MILIKSISTSINGFYETNDVTTLYEGFTRSGLNFSFPFVGQYCNSILLSKGVV